MLWGVAWDAGLTLLLIPALHFPDLFFLIIIYFFFFLYLPSFTILFSSQPPLELVIANGQLIKCIYFTLHFNFLSDNYDATNSVGLPKLVLFDSNNMKMVDTSFQLVLWPRVECVSFDRNWTKFLLSALFITIILIWRPNARQSCCFAMNYRSSCEWCQLCGTLKLPS